MSYPQNKIIFDVIVNLFAICTLESLCQNIFEILKFANSFLTFQPLFLMRYPNKKNAIL